VLVVATGRGELAREPTWREHREPPDGDTVPVRGQGRSYIKCNGPGCGGTRSRRRHHQRLRAAPPTNLPGRGTLARPVRL